MDDQKMSDKQMKAMLLEQQLQAIMKAQQTVIKLTGICFEKCIATPGRALSSSNQQCLWRCSQRYIESQHFVNNRSKDLVNESAPNNF